MSSFFLAGKRLPNRNEPIQAIAIIPLTEYHEILVKEALIKPHRTVIDPTVQEEDQIQLLRQALKEQMKRSAH